MQVVINVGILFWEFYICDKIKPPVIIREFFKLLLVKIIIIYKEKGKLFGTCEKLVGYIHDLYKCINTK